MCVKTLTMNTEKPYKDKKRCCRNCGVYGHVSRICHRPIMSIGIIAVRKSELDNINSSEYFNMRENNKYSEIVDKFKKTDKKPVLKYLLVQRRDSIGYINILRGSYKDETQLRIYINDLTLGEREKLLKAYNNIFYFDILWDDFWVNHNCACYTQIKARAQERFSKLNIEELLSLCVSTPAPLEWGFPKGRRNTNETDMMTGLREFTEETGYTIDDIESISTEYVDEVFFGTNSVKYLHRYFIAIIKENAKVPQLNPNNIHQKGEIGDIGWFTITEAKKLFRVRHVAKKNVLNQVNKKLTLSNNLNFNKN